MFFSRGDANQPSRFYRFMSNCQGFVRIHNKLFIRDLIVFFFKIKNIAQTDVLAARFLILCIGIVGK